MIKQVYASVTHLNERFDDHVSKPVVNWLKCHPNINTIERIANHILRAMAMLGFMYLLPYSLLTNCCLALGASLFYRITTESSYCILRFAMPACAGAIAFEFSKEALAALISRAAFQSIGSFAQALVGISPLALYMTAIVYISYTTVHNAKSETSCHQTPKSDEGCHCS
jgi:hypothetical protein